MPSSNFQQWNPAAVNQESDAAYTADSLRTGGAPVDGLLPSPTFNKFAYQASTFVAAFGIMMANKGYSLDDADISVLAAVLGNLVTDNETLPALIAVGYSPNPVFDCSTSNGFQMTLAGNIASVTVPGSTPGQLVAFVFVQDAIGGRTIAWGFSQPDPAPNATSIILLRTDLSGTFRMVGPMMSINGAFFPALLKTGSLTLAAPGTAGQVLTNVGGVFVPANTVTLCTVSDVTGSRALGTAYQNTSGKTMRVYGCCSTSGSSVGSLAFLIGASSPTTKLWGNENTSSVSGADAGFVGEVPNGWFYQLNSTGDIGSVSRWMELLS